MNKPNDKRLHESAEAELALRDVKGRALKGVASLLARQGITEYSVSLECCTWRDCHLKCSASSTQFVVTFFCEISNMGLCDSVAPEAVHRSRTALFSPYSRP
jgi:hypothetical protein